MFNYPLILSNSTLYSRLGISPEARADDIRDAKNEQMREFEVLKKGLEKRIAFVQDKIPDLTTRRESLRELINDDKHRKSKDLEYQKLLKEIDLLEKEALRIDPEFNELEKKLDDINQKIKKLNIIKLESEEERQKYDAASPGCAILKLEDYQPEILTEPRTRLFFIRKSISDFFEKDMAVPCYHPSDFTRSFFYSDYEPNSIIDKQHHA